MDSTRQKIQGRLKSESEKNLNYLHSLSSEDWEQQVYTTGSEWDVRKILSHFVSTEKALHKLIQNVVDGGSGAPRDFDINEFNEGEATRLGDQPIETLLDDFSEARNRTCELVAEMSDEDMSKIGYHPWFGDLEVESILKLIYRHIMIHLRDVRKAIAMHRPVPHQDIEPPTNG